MMKFRTLIVLTGAILSTAFFKSQAATSVEQYGITWTFKGDHPVGNYANGDFWVVGPVNIISIHNAYHSVEMGLDGSEINPDGAAGQGYDNRLSSYVDFRNKSHPNGSPISATNPLALAVNSSLLSSVSWVVGETGCPKINSATDTPRPCIRATAILTCVSNAPSAGTFRPAYCGSDKTPNFNVSQLDYSALGNLAPVASTPDLAVIESSFRGPWVDHATSWIGAYIHPTMHMPEYGRDLSIAIGQGALMLNLDFSKLPGSPSKETLLIRFTQLGIDLAGIADVGGGWICDGGHMLGRKWPILFAGVVLNDAHLQSVGEWGTPFQEDQDTFYVSQASVDRSHSSAWIPDNRAAPLPYEVENIDMPEWGIRHETQPLRDNMHLEATYRGINSQSYIGWVLAAHSMGQTEAWNHDALFDYMDRIIAIDDPYAAHWFRPYGSDFVKEMWQTYRADFGPVWTADDPSDFYSQGSRL